ncbi:MAG: ATP-binding cassette domain-containing protein [Lachnospiraceae bacterium]|nr:ATP-binding cassette domain-containing protein [Lachnospiraceae bacterium]
MEYVIETENLTKYYGKVKALDGLSMRVEKGSIHALVGPNGSGKTTLV